MSGITEIKEKMIGEQYELPVGKVAAEESSAPVANSIPSGETEKLFKAREDLQRATTPTLQNLEREPVLKAQSKVVKTTEEQFALAKELFKIKIQALKNTEVSIEEFSKENKKNRGIFYTPKFDEETKNEIIKLHKNLVDLAQKQSKEGSLQNLSLQLYALEQETGFFDFGSFLLWKAVEIDFNLLKGAFHRKDLAQMQQLYWSHFVPNFQKVLSYRETDTRNVIFSNWAIAQGADVLALCQKVFLTSKPDDNPFIQFLPVLLYLRSERIELFFPEQFKDLSPLDKIGRYIYLCCRAAESFIPTDTSKAAGYLLMAAQEAKAKLWTLPYPFHNKAYEQKQKECLEKIKQLVEKIDKTLVAQEG